MDMKKLAEQNRLVKMYAGSIAYGTNIASSDVDFRGLFCAEPINIRTPFFPIREYDDTSEEDTKYYELAHFMKLCLDCNPNIIELLWTDESDIVFSTPAYEYLRSKREDLLSTKVAFTFSGYAIAQLKRIKGHNKWINNPYGEAPPKMTQFVKLVQNFTEGKIFEIDINDYYDGYRLVPYGGNIFGIVEAPGYKTFNTNVPHHSLNSVWEDNEDVDEMDSLARKKPLFVVKFNKDEYLTEKERHKQYWTWKKNRNEKRSVLEEQFGYDCYSDDTEFLTDDGWKLFDDVDENDLLATFNQHSHRIEYQIPSERIDSLFTGNMYQFSGHHTDTLVTSNHHMFVRNFSRTTNEVGPWEFKRAAELPETFDSLRRIEPKKNRQILPKNFNTNILNKYNMLDYLRILGWFVSDGTINFYKRDVPKSLRISQSKPQSKLTQTLNKQRNAGKIECKHYLYEATGISNFPENVWVFDKQTATFVYDDCGHGSKHKRLPDWAFYLTRREMTTLLVALLQGDGSKKNHQQHTYGYHTTNKLLADDVQRLAVLCGYETSLYVSKTNNMFEVYINMRPPQYKRTTRSRVEKIPVVNKRIVCFMVPNFTLITRRNGQVSFHGNTKHAMHLVRLLRMGEEILTTGQVNVKRPDAAELLDIRNGSMTYEEIVKYAEIMDNKVRNVHYNNSVLRKRPDLKVAAQILMETQDHVWNL